MPSRYEHVVWLPAKGGLDTTTAPVLLSPEDLVTALNVEYDTHGLRRKRLGTARYNTATVNLDASPANFMAVADHWRFANSTSGTQKFVAHIATSGGGNIVKDDGDGVWDTIWATAFGSTSSRTNITIASGYSVISVGNATPLKWDQNTVTVLSVNAPFQEGNVYHVRKLFGFGIPNKPSSVWYSTTGDITNWSGADAGLLDFDEDDGDRVVGLSQTWRKRLYVFKGPNFGSIHEVSGSLTADFTKGRLFTGAPCVAHRGIITTTNDIYWCSRYGFHSLLATQKYGDTEESYISRPVQETFNNLNRSRLDQVVGFNHPSRNLIGWFAPSAGQTQNDTGLMYNTVTQQWSIWQFTGVVPISCAVMLDPTTQTPRLYIGGHVGHLYKGDQTTYNDEAADRAYSYEIKTPVIHTLPGKDALTEMELDSITTFYRPLATGSSSATLTVIIDGVSQSFTLDLTGGGDVLG